MLNCPPDHRPRAWSRILPGAALLALLFLVQRSAFPVAAQTPSPYLLLKLASQAEETPWLALSDHGLARWEQLPVPGWVRVRVPQDRTQMLAALRADPAVQVIEEDHRVRVALAPNDPYWEYQWGPEIVRAPAAWAIHTGQDVVVAVLDTGIDVLHEDLAGQIWVNPGEIPDNGKDDDENGYVDDLHGWRFVHDSAARANQSNVIDDDHGHGTHVSGSIAARGNNGQGIAGIAWDSRVMVVKVLDQNGDGYYSALASGLIYAADNGAQIANLSLGGSMPSQVLQDAVDYAHAHGTLIIASAGNNSSDIQYPAAYDHVMAVAASTRQDERASYSCYGPEMDVTAPGTSILSTCLGSHYCYKSGTSMAAPHVAGLAALIYAELPASSPDQVAQLLRDTAQDIQEQGWDPYTGWGRIDAYHALASIQTQFNLYFPMVETGGFELESQQ